VANVRWHKTGRATEMVEDRLKIYTNPADAPGRSHGSFSTMQALQIVLKEEQPHAMTEVLREMERARMTAEDLRGKTLSHYTGDSRTRFLTWRECAQGAVEPMDNAIIELADIRLLMRRASESDIERVPHRDVLRICDDSVGEVMDELVYPTSDHDL